MDESAPPVNIIENKNMNRFLTYNNSYKLFNIEENHFYNSSKSKNKINHKSKIEKDINKTTKKEKYKAYIAIDTEKLKLLSHNNLIELIQLIEFTCDIYLNDSRYIDKTYNIFKIIKNQDNKRYDIILNNSKEKSEKEKEEYKNEESEDEEEDCNDNEEENEEEEDDYEDNNSLLQYKRIKKFFFWKK